MHFHDTLIINIFCLYVGLMDDFDIVMASESSREDVDDPECPTNDFSTDESDFDMHMVSG